RREHRYADARAQPRFDVAGEVDVVPVHVLLDQVEQRLARFIGVEDVPGLGELAGDLQQGELLVGRRVHVEADVDERVLRQHFVRLAAAAAEQVDREHASAADQGDDQGGDDGDDPVLLALAAGGGRGAAAEVVGCARP